MAFQDVVVIWLEKGNDESRELGGPSPARAGSQTTTQSKEDSVMDFRQQKVVKGESVSRVVPKRNRDGVEKEKRLKTVVIRKAESVRGRCL